MRALLLRWWPVAPLVAAFVGFGLHGLDFGHHWDEPWFFLPLKRFARDGHWLPGAYNYPSLSYYLSYLAGAPEVVMAWLDGKTGADLHRAVLPVVDQPYFRLRARALFLAVTAMTVPGIYGSVLATGHRPWVAATATAAVVGSFEVAYHARWIAPDGPLLAASAWTTWCLATAALPDERRAVRARRWAAVGAGLAAGTKYPAGLLLVPVLLLVARAAWTAPDPSIRLRRGLRETAVIVVTFAVVYLLTTPGTLFDTARFIQHIEAQMRTYGGGFGAYTVGAGPDHLARMLLYLTGTLWSPFPLVAFAMSGTAAWGAVRWARQAPWSALAILSFPLLFVAYFGLQRTMIIRNLLVVVPPLAVALAWGTAGLGAAFARRPPLRAMTVGLLFGLIVANLAFVGWAAETVRVRRDTARFTQLAADFVDRQPDGEVFVSPRVKRRLRGVRRTLAVRTATAAADAALLVFETDEGFASRGRWPAHVWGLTETWFGPWELNFDRYPTWDGDPRILVMTGARARAVQLRLLKDAQP